MIRSINDLLFTLPVIALVAIGLILAPIGEGFNFWIDFARALDKEISRSFQ